MSKMAKVSIIMPVYNSERYVSYAIDSVLNQSFEDFELILVDDGSVDKSGQICDVYAQKDARIRVIHQRNQGLCAARNAGLNIAKGDYIGFIDNDDFYYPDLIKDNYSLAFRYGADVIRFDRLRLQTFDDNKKPLKDVSGTRGMFKKGEKISVFRGKEIIQQYQKIKKSGALYGIWNGLFRRQFLEDNNLRFDTRIKFGGEDCLLNMQALEKAECYVFHKGVYYRYERRYGNSTSTKFDKNRLEAIEILSEKDRELVERVKNNSGLLLYNQTDYIIEVIKILSHPKCPWTCREKYKYLQYLQEKSSLHNGQYQKYEKDVYKQNILMGIMSSFFYRKKFNICFVIVNVYMRIEKYRTIFIYKLRGR